MTDTQSAGWSDGRRDADGMRVVELTPGHWLVVPADGRPPLAYCSCCGRPFRKARYACQAADVLYPPR